MALASKHNISVKTQFYAKSWSKHSLVEHLSCSWPSLRNSERYHSRLQTRGLNPSTLSYERWTLPRGYWSPFWIVTCGSLKCWCDNAIAKSEAVTLVNAHNIFRIVDHAKVKSEYLLLFLPTAVTLSCINTRGLFWNVDKRWRHHCHDNETRTWLFMLSWPWFWRPQDKLEATITNISEQKSQIWASKFTGRLIRKFLAKLPCLNATCSYQGPVAILLSRSSLASCNE